MYKEISASTKMDGFRQIAPTVYTIEGVVVTREEWVIQLRINSIPGEIKKLQEEYNRLLNINPSQPDNH